MNDTIQKALKIRGELLSLIENAKRRTKGKWKLNKGRRMLISVDSLHEDPILWGDEFDISDCDAEFIVSCAGPAEKAWKSVVASIDGILLECEGFKFPEEDRAHAWAALIEIVKTWESA